MDESVMKEVVHQSHVFLLLLIAGAALLWSVVEYLRGSVNGQDVSFIVLRLSNHRPKRIQVCTQRTDKLRDIVENTFLRACMTYWFWKRKGHLHVADEGQYTELRKKWQRTFLSPFVDEWSEIANAEFGTDWAMGKAYSKTEFVFGVTNVRSSRGRRKIRVIAITRSALECIRTEGLESITFTEREEFIRNILAWMLKNPTALESYSAFRAEEPNGEQHGDRVIMEPACAATAETTAT